jgi:hypothetical protein
MVVATCWQFWVNREARGRQLGESGGPRKTIVIGIVIGNGGKKGVQCQLLEAAFLTFLIDLADWNLKKILFSWSKDSIHDVTGSAFLSLFLLDRKSRVSDEKLLHVVPPNYCRKIKGAMQYDLGDDSTPVWQSGEFFFFGSSPIENLNHGCFLNRSSFPSWAFSSRRLSTCP